MEKIWKLNFLFQEDLEEKRELTSLIEQYRATKARIQIPEKLLRILFTRGVKNLGDLIKFFKPDKTRLYDPFLMKDCDKATERVLKAIENREKIMVLGDYDVDGICGASMFYLFFKEYDLNAEVYIPNRLTEGYGVSIAAIDYALKKDVSLIISVDCGITANEQIDYANQKGVDFVVCDHHKPPPDIPRAVAVMNPSREDCNYPCKCLCATGVAFKLIQSLASQKGNIEFAYSLLDFVALATVSDIVPIIDENRIFVTEGFKLINENPRPAIRTLLNKIGYQENMILNVNTIVYSVAPRINAVGRLGDAKRAVELLTSEDPAKLNELATTLDEENYNRREKDKKITEEAIELFESLKTKKLYHSIVLHKEDWHAGVIGIVAARLVERYNLPTVILTTINGVAKGSGRSVNGFNLYEAVKQCEEYVMQFGGHNHAVGIEIELHNLKPFWEKFDSIAREHLSQQNSKNEIEIDAEISLDEINAAFLGVLKFFEPYGPGNPVPTFITKDVRLISPQEVRNDTLLFSVKSTSGTSKNFEAILFNASEYKDKIKDDIECDICYTIDLNEWNGKAMYKFRVKDIRFK
ncbi:MAG: single-stranded-DNA-specific exonuclease RecJ [Ignavibacteria bacterium]